MLNRLWSTRPYALGVGLLIVRLTLGFLMLPHGWSKLAHYSERADKFPDPLGVSSPISMILVIFAEFFCSCFLLMGLFTRLALIPLIINMTVAVLAIHAGDPLSDREGALLFLIPYIGLFFTGPGDLSVDRLLKK